MPNAASSSVAARRPWEQRDVDRAVALHERFLRGARGGQRAFLRYAEATGIDCRRRLLNDADFTGANLAGSAFTGSHFERAALYCVNLEGCDLRAANLRRADLRGARLAGAVLSGAVMDEADMRAATIAFPTAESGLQVLRHGAAPAASRGAAGLAADFTDCAMRGVRLCAANLKGANFTGAVLEHADLSWAKLTDAIFKDTVLDGVDLERITLTADQLSGCVFGPDTAALARGELIRERLRRAEEWVQSGGRYGEPASLDGEDLRPVQGAFRGRVAGVIDRDGVAACRRCRRDGGADAAARTGHDKNARSGQGPVSSVAKRATIASMSSTLISVLATSASSMRSCTS